MSDWPDVITVGLTSVRDGNVVTEIWIIDGDAYARLKDWFGQQFGEPNTVGMAGMDKMLEARETSQAMFLHRTQDAPE